MLTVICHSSRHLNNSTSSLRNNMHLLLILSRIIYRSRVVSPSTGPSVSCIQGRQHSVWTAGTHRNSSTGVTHDQQGTTHRDFYTQLVQAAVNLQLKKDKKAGLKNQNDYKLQNNLNLTPFRQNKTREGSKSYRISKTRESTNTTHKNRTQVCKNRPSVTESNYSPLQSPSHHSLDSASTCSSNGSSTVSQGQGQVKGYIISGQSTQPSIADRSVISSSASSKGSSHHPSASSPTKSTHHVGPPPNTPSSLTDKMSARFPVSEFTLRREVLCRVSMMEQHNTEMDADHRMPVCEAATWF